MHAELSACQAYILSMTGKNSVCLGGVIASKQTLDGLDIFTN